ncbi:MAG: hypothetical protein MK066_06725 [Crocinitomicaceae bacterium]|nr:hypothetical protein [Crocinitomicaceae bacterium]
MKAHFLLFSLILLGCRQINHSKLTFNDKKTDLEITTIDDGLKFTNTISKINLNNLKTNKGQFQHLTLDNYVKSGKIGEPQLARISKMIKVPSSHYPELILDSSLHLNKQIHLKKYKLVPLQASESKPDSAGIIILSNYDETSYKKNFWTKNETVSLIKVGKTKEHVLYRLTINPIMYNPHKNKLKLLTEIQGTIQFIPKIGLQ